MVANTLRRCLQRGGDFVARYGGEEFAVIAASSDAAGMAVLAERLRAGIEQLGIPHAGSPVGVVTASFGVAVLVPNVRGSSGYGRTYLSLDNGAKREDSVKDIGALLD